MTDSREHPTPDTVLQRGGWGGLLAAVLLLTSTVINLLAPVGNPYATATDYVHQAILVVAFECAAGVIVALAVLLRRTGRFGRLAVVGAVLAGSGYFLIGVLGLANLIQGQRILIPVRLGAAAVLLVGSVLLGVLVLITRVLPWWCGVALIIAFPLGDVANELVGGSEGILLALLWGSIGFALLRRASSGQHRSAGTPTEAVGNR